MNSPCKLAAVLAADMADFSGLTGLRRYAQAPRKLRRELLRSRIAPDSAPSGRNSLRVEPSHS
jgi:hypothetical protein